MSKEGMNVYRLYVALKNHFKGKFDYTKNKTRIKISRERYLQRNDWKLFEMLANRTNDYLRDLFIAHFLEDENKHISEIIQNQQLIIDFKKRLNNLYRLVENDMNNIVKFCLVKNITIEDMFRVKTDFPPLLKLAMQRYIILETPIVIDYAIEGVFNFWKSQIKDDIIAPTWIRKLEAYEKLLIHEYGLDKRKCICYTGKMLKDFDDASKNRNK